MVGIFVRPHSHHRRDAREIRTSNGAAAFLLLRKPWENNKNKLEMVEEGDDELFECGGGGRKEFANLSNCCSRLIWKICFLLKVLAKFYAPAV